jgi:hypothetical protein
MQTQDPNKCPDAQDGLFLQDHNTKTQDIFVDLFGALLGHTGLILSRPARWLAIYAFLMVIPIVM